MQALLGKITGIVRRAEPVGGGVSLEIGFRAACVLPERTKVPEWLEDQTLTVRREVRDAREIGGPGDRIVLTPDESAPWLRPLSVTPGVPRGGLPETLTLRLRWWKDEKPPEYGVRANGRLLSGTFTADGDGYVATVETASLFDFPPRLPVTLEVVCDKLKAACTALPDDTPGAWKVSPAAGERFRIENGWYAAEVITQGMGGGIASLVEKGRGVDHFRVPENRIQRDLEYGGHSDRYRSGWDWPEKLRTVAMTCAGARREGGATRLALEGLVDEGQNLRTTVVYTLPDDLPLVLLQRDFHFGGAKKDDKEKEEKPKEPMDDLRAVGLGFRAAWAAERREGAGSRLLYSDGGGLAVTRGARAGEWLEFFYWTLADGWAAVEHPGRREYTLYLFDREAPPYLTTFFGEQYVTLEPHWPIRPVRPEESVGYTLALTSGERCGASDAGAWVACRAALPEGGVRCAVIARLRLPDPDASAAFTLAGETRETPLRAMLLPGVGAVACATADFPEAKLADDFTAAAAGIPIRKSEKT